jgi:hypothetical protein
VSEFGSRRKSAFFMAIKALYKIGSWACGLVGYSASFAMKRSGVRISPGPLSEVLRIREKI